MYFFIPQINFFCLLNFLLIAFSELANISEELLAKENELNQNLEEHSILLPTPLDAAISKWIQYKPA